MRTRLGRDHPLIRRLEAGDSYGLLLALIIVTYGLMALVEFGDWSRVVLSALFGGILILALHTSHVRGRWMKISFVIVAAGFAINLVDAVTGSTQLHATAFVMLLPMAIAPLVVLGRILSHPVVNAETLLGAISAYLLIGILFAACYAVMNVVSPPFFAQSGHHDAVSYLYFSFVVITTLGFGDLTPLKDGPRIVVSLEALIGQIFLVTLVARLVSQYGTTREGLRGEVGPEEVDG